MDTSQLPRQSRALSNASASLILDNRELLWYPIAASIFTVTVTQGYALTLGRVLKDGWGAALEQVPVAILTSLAFVLSTAALAAEAETRFQEDFSNAGIGIDVALDRLAALTILAVIIGVPQVALVAIADQQIALAVVLFIAELVGAGVVIPIIVTESVGLAAAARRGAELLRVAWRELLYGAARYIAGFVLALLGLLAAGFTASFILSEVAGRGITILLVIGIGLAFIIALAFLAAQWTAFCVAVHRLEAGQPVRGYGPGATLRANQSGTR
jgi:hypothetical protein